MHQDDADQQGGGISLEDIYFTVFRHKWMILAFVCLGAIAAALVPILRPAPYVSWGTLMVPYVIDRSAAPLTTGGGTEVTSTSMGGQGAMNSEMEILKSADVATKAAEVVGPAKILAKKGGGDDLSSAAAVVAAGVDVENPKGTDMLVVSFKHPDKSVAQATLKALVEAYKEHSLEVHMGGKDLEAFYRSQIEDWRVKLAETDQKLRNAKQAAGVVNIEEAKKAIQTDLAKWDERLRDAQGELAERMAIHPTQGSGVAVTNADSVMPPADKIEEYSAMLTDLNQAKKAKRELINQHHYTEINPIVQNVQTSIEKLDRQRRSMEKEFPALAGMGANVNRTGTNSFGADMADDLSAIRRLTARVTYVTTVISNIQQQASHIMDHEGNIATLQVSEDMMKTNYQSIATLVQQSLIRKDLSAVNGNVSIVQKATPAAKDMKKLRKLIGGAFVVLAGLGLAIAFFLDFVWNRTIRRSADVERKLHVPVFLTIPDITWDGKLKLPWAKTEPAANVPLLTEGEGETTTAIAQWKPGEQLDSYLEGLKERLMTYFEVQNLNMKKPKLVAVTGCEKGVGVSTVASGLAAALSNTGNGSVLLVDMNKGQGLAKSFTKGDVTRGLTEMLQTGDRDDAKIQENLYVASVENETEGNLSRTLPSKFNHLVPKLKASDYDYIIFDMPPVTQTSATPRLASYMDITLMVLESEKTGQQMAERANALMRAARANVAAVLNKYRPHVPARLSHEL